MKASMYSICTHAGTSYAKNKNLKVIEILKTTFSTLLFFTSFTHKSVDITGLTTVLSVLKESVLNKTGCDRFNQACLIWEMAPLLQSLKQALHLMRRNGQFTSSCYFKLRENNKQKSSVTSQYAFFVNTFRKERKKKK